MRTVPLVLALASIVAIAVTGCGGGSGHTELPASKYFPLAQGNQWYYKVTDHTVDSSGVVTAIGAHRPLLLGSRLLGLTRVRTAQDGPGESVLIVSISGTKPIDSIAWFEAVTLQAGLETETVYFRHDANGLLVTGSAEDQPSYRIRGPIEAGNTWSPPFDENWQIEIVAAGETIDVQAGAFTDCLQIQESGTWEEETYRGVAWFAPNIGLVCTEDYFDGELAVESELTSYNVAAN